MSNKKKVMLISRNFPPLVGGMERLIYHAYDELRKEYHCHVIGPEGSSEFIKKPDSVSECGVTSIPLFLINAFVKGVKAAMKDRFDLCIAGSGVSAPIAVAIGKIFGIPVAVYVHGLDLIADNWIYQKLFVPTISKAQTVIANSNNTSQLAQNKGINKAKVKILNPGVSIISPNSNFMSKIREKHNLKDKKIILSVGRLISRKGIAEFIRYSLPAIVKEIPESIFLVIGSFPKNALKKGCSEKERIDLSIKQSEMQNHVIMLGSVDDNVLTSAFIESDIFVFPVLDIPGDVEGFGMVSIEAAAHGLATIAFDSGGVSDAIDNGKTGFLIKQGDYLEFSRRVIAFLNGDEVPFTQQKCHQHANKFSWPKFGKKLLSICNNSIEDSIK